MFFFYSVSAVQQTARSSLHFHPNKVEIFSSHIIHNYNYLSQLNKEISIAPVLKSNAYGHNIIAMAHILENLKPPFLCVYSLQEAYELYNANIKIPILIFGHIDPRSIMKDKLPFSYAIYDKRMLAIIDKYQPHAKLHIFVDTGMHREGIRIEKLKEFLLYSKTFKNIQIEGLMSHFASGDKPENSLTRKQLSTFDKARQIVHQMGIPIKWVHIAASTALLHHENYGKRLGNLARVGIALYGIDPENKNKNLKPVLRLTTTLSQTKEIKKGEKIGYDFTFTARKNTKLGILPIGYYDGVNRNLSNKGFVYINNTKCQIIGRVSMNITTVDISSVKNPRIGQKVIMFSNSPEHKNVISQVAKTCKTIPYEILINLETSVERIIL